MVQVSRKTRAGASRRPQAASLSAFDLFVTRFGSRRLRGQARKLSCRLPCAAGSSCRTRGCWSRSSSTVAGSCAWVRCARAPSSRPKARDSRQRPSREPLGLSLRRRPDGIACISSPIRSGRGRCVPGSVPPEASAPRLPSHPPQRQCRRAHRCARAARPHGPHVPTRLPESCRSSGREARSPPQPRPSPQFLRSPTGRSQARKIGASGKL